jgi:hypothetical protein
MARVCWIKGDVFYKIFLQNAAQIPAQLGEEKTSNA